jgi:protein phosphatase 2C family protein 2/3
LESKITSFGGNPKVLITKPSITTLKLNKKSDFILIGCDGIFDNLDNENILRLIWSFKKKGKTIENIHKLSADITDCVIKYSMKKLSEDNVTVIFFAFQNFQEKMKDEEFEYDYNGNICKYIGGEIDLGL